MNSINGSKYSQRKGQIIGSFVSDFGDSWEVVIRKNGQFESKYYLGSNDTDWEFGELIMIPFSSVMIWPFIMDISEQAKVLQIIAQNKA